jgi:hypothetical protein
MVSAGYSQAVRWGNETAYGSAAVINKDLGAVQSISPSERNNLIKVRNLGGTRDYKTVMPGKFEISGSMEYFLQGGAFLRQAWGEDTASTDTVDSGAKVLSAAGNVFRHTMGSANSPGVNDFPSFTLEFTGYDDAGGSGTTNLKRTYTGCRVNSLTLSGNVDEPVRVNVDWMAKRVTVGTGAPASITEYSQDPFIFYDGFVYLTSGAVTSQTTQASLKTDALCQVMSFDFSLNNNLESHWYIAGTCSTLDSARSAKYIIPKSRDYELRLGLHYSNKEMYERFLGTLGATTDQKTLDKAQVVLDMVKSGTPGTIAAGDHWMRLVCASATFDDIAINGAPEDIVNNDITVFAKGTKLYFVDNDSDYR